MAHSYENIICLENLCLAWEEFIIGKKKKQDVIDFGRSLMDNIVELHEALVNRTYRHGSYESFYITDPKRRHIHKASMRDRLLHHAVYRILYPFFDRTFIGDSFSCRDNKGVHKALNRFRRLAWRASRNHTRNVWVFKCDIRKFFARVDHQILLAILHTYIPDTDILRLLQNIIESYHTESNPGIGLPLGNLTSQLFANVYLNRLDHWAKHALKSHYYVRYADDFVLLSRDRFQLAEALPKIQEFLQTQLKLSLHPDKILLKTVASGMDFLGWVHFSSHCLLRTKTKQRMLQNIRNSISEAGLTSYLGLISHGNTAGLRERVMEEYWLWN
ncbi:MAG: group II intron reverse transcriptase domain-containing protein [Candidatus Magasanikbacteria bacterium]|nr:group II intron reverse transcriptase domain-containing protein [Candidatus Magasanikbacteria bacterium]